MKVNNKKLELIRYIFVGISTVLIDLFIYKLLVNLFIIDIAKTLSFITGTLWSYQLNRIWTFKAGRSNLSQFTKYIIIHLSSLILNVSINSILIKSFPVNFLWHLDIAFICATFTSAVYNFLFIKFYLFNKCK